MTRSMLYEQDFHAWTVEQAGLIRSGAITAADVEGIADEIESMGRGERREFVNRLAVLLAHLLKWQRQPAFRGKSWQLTIDEQRLRIADHLADNPSLRASSLDSVPSAYRRACLAAARETGLERTDFPAACPFTLEQALDEAFWPGDPA